MLFNDLLRQVGIDADRVRLLRHHTKPGIAGRSLYDLWRTDRAAFELYQRTQKAERGIFRSGDIWASFVVPSRGNTRFVGLYGARYDGTRPVTWECPYRGGLPGDGAPVDVFETHLRSELADLIGELQIEWDERNVRTWCRKASGAQFPVVAPDWVATQQPILTGVALIHALEELGFDERHRTQKVILMRREHTAIYVKRENNRLPLIVHPRFFDLSPQISALGIALDRPIAPYINSNLREFPVYSRPERSTTSRIGLDLGVPGPALAPLVDLLDAGAYLDTGEGRVRIIETSDAPLTERERLSTARIGQGEFRTALFAAWNGTCPISGIDHPELLRASHIKPWAASSHHERLDPNNGILLAAHLDALFDRGLISFSESGALLISPEIGDKNIERLRLNAVGAIDGLTQDHQPFLAHHRERFRRRSMSRSLLQNGLEFVFQNSQDRL
jgi:hypothetical protein